MHYTKKVTETDDICANLCRYKQLGGEVQNILINAAADSVVVSQVQTFRS